MATYPAGTHTVGPGQWPYPDGSQPAFPPGDIQQLAQRIAQMSGTGIGYLPNQAALGTLVANGDAFPGLQIYTPDTDVVWKYNGSAWVPVGNYFAQSVGAGNQASSSSAFPAQSIQSSTANHPTVLAASTQGITVQTQGYVRVIGQCLWGSNTSGNRQIVVNRNGSAASPLIGETTTAVGISGGVAVSATGVLAVNAGDVLTLTLLQNSGSTLGYNSLLTVEWMSAN